jgi:RNA recognition motif-containing protein
MAVRLFVGNLPYDVTESELSQLFAEVGGQPSVRLPVDRETGKPRGFAFVEFGDRGQAEEAIRRFNQQLFKGRPLAVNEARAREDGPAARPGGVRPPPAPRPSSWGADAPSPDEQARVGQPRRTFGPDAAPRGKKKYDAKSPKGERQPKGPLKERSGGQFFAGDVEEEEGGEDDFALWAKEKDGDKEDEG